MGIKKWLKKATGRESVADIEEDIRIHKARAQAYRDATMRLKRPPAMSSNTQIVSSRTVVCYETGEKHSALLLIHEDGAITVKCPGECVLCDYERLL